MSEENLSDITRGTASLELGKMHISQGIEIGLDPTKMIKEVVINGNHIAIPLDGQAPFTSFEVMGGRERVLVEDFASHPMNLHNRWPEAREADEKKRRQLIKVHQDRIIVTTHSMDGRVVAYIFPKTFHNNEAIGVIAISSNPDSLPFSIQMLEIRDGQAIPVIPQTPQRGAKILHGTQIIGHVKDGCDMQVKAHEKGTLVANWNFAFPPTARTAVNQEEAAQRGAPTYDVTRNWSYAGPTDDFRSNFFSHDSFKSVVGFVAANAELCLDAAKGRYAVVSTNFRSEGQLLKFINPHILLGGINFTFLNGRPGERARFHNDLPRFVKMLKRVQASLDKAPDRVVALGLPRDWSDDWWRICAEKMQHVNFLLFRTFSKDDSIPRVVNGTQIIQIPHPIPEIHLSREQARSHLSSIIGRQLVQQDHVVLLPGTSDDGGTSKRIPEVVAMARENSHLIVITPMNREDPRLVGVDLPPNVYSIGFRDDWMDIIPAGDVTFLRGSWGEILDAVAAGNVPIITSPGVVPGDKPLGETQFLTEVSGERASNISLLIRELQNNGVKTSTIEGLLADILDHEGHLEVTRALTHALRPEVREEIRKALSMIKRGGIRWMVDVHDMLLDKRSLFTERELRKLQRQIWSNENAGRRWIFLKRR